MVKKSQQQNHLDYWTKRQEDILRFLDQADIDMSLELSKVYREQAFQAQKDLFEFYQRYAEDNNMTYQDVVKKLTHEDLSDYRENAERYRKQAEKDPELLKRINEQYVSAKATRLDALHLDLLFKVGIMKGIIDKSFENYLKSASNYAYKKAVGGRVGTLNTPALNELVNTPFNGYNYSEQLWGNVDNLVRDLKDTLKKGFVRGDNPRSLARDLAKKYDVAKYRAETLLRTDGTMIINNATAKRYIDSGIKYYRDLVRLDGRTTEICRRIARLNERKLLSEMKPGVNAAPYHYNCRTTIIPDDEEVFADTDEVDYNQNMNNLDLMAKRQSFEVGKDIRVRAKKVSGTNYDFWVQDNTKKIRDTLKLVESNLKNLSSYEVPKIVFVKKSRLPGWAGYNYEQDILFISDLLNSEEAVKDMLLDNYFASKDLQGILVHELTHKKHWDTAKEFYKNNRKRYNSVEEAKNAMDSPLISYIKSQQQADYNYLYKISDYADIAGFEGKYNEVIAEAVTAGDSLQDSLLLKKIKEVLKWK